MISYQQSGFREMLQRLSDGDEEAAWQIVEEYGPYILRVVRRKLNDNLRPKFDSQDFVQAVWASFFTHDVDVDGIESPQQLIALLASIAKHKIIDQHRRRLCTQKYNVNRERSLQDSAVARDADLNGQVPTPSEVMIAREQWRLLMDDQPEHYQEIIRRRFRGETLEGIADELSISERTVRRVLAKLLNSASRNSVMASVTDFDNRDVTTTSQILTDFKARWRAGQRPDATTTFTQHPELDWRRSQKLDLIYEEYCQNIEHGQSISLEGFCGRYPSYARSIYRQLEVHRFLESNPDFVTLDDTDPWPDIGDGVFEFTIVEELGRGAFARVYLCSQSGVGDRLVVVKVARHGAAEANTLGRLEHPNIVPIYSVKSDSETSLSAICMPYQGRATLCDVIDLVFSNNEAPTKGRAILDALGECGKVPSQDGADGSYLCNATYVDGAVHIGRQLAEALQHAHQRGICHRDLKPSNVLVAPDGAPLLLDFNLSEDPLGRSTFTGGTLPYMAPEQIKSMVLGSRDPSDQCDEQSDIYSLGVILYEMISGQHPFGSLPPTWELDDAANELLVRQAKTAASLTSLNKDVDSTLADCITSCIAFDRSSRPSSMDDVIDGLRKSQRWTRLAKRMLSRHKSKVRAAAAVILIAVVCIAVWLVQRPPFAERMHQAALQHYEAGEPTKAIMYLDRSLAADSARAESWYWRGLAHVKAGAFQAAFDDFTKATECGDDPRYVAYRGYCASRTEKHLAARHYYEEAISRKFNTLGIHNNLGCSYLATNSLDRADDQFKQAIRLYPDAAILYANRAKVSLGLARRKVDYIPGKDIRDGIEWAVKRGLDDAESSYVAARVFGFASQRSHDQADFFRSKACEHLRQAIRKGAVTSKRDLSTNPAFVGMHETLEFTGLMEQRLRTSKRPTRSPFLPPLQDAELRITATR